MSMLPIEPDIDRHCFQPCPPGTFCKCLGEWIPDPDRKNLAVSDEDRRHTDEEPHCDVCELPEEICACGEYDESGDTPDQGPPFCGL